MGATNIPSVTHVLDNISPVSAISGAISSVTDGIGKIFSSPTGKSGKSDTKLPIANPLHKYASYSYIISLSCLDANGYNHPDKSYIAGKLPPLICKSASMQPNDRITLDGGKFDFFIDDLVIDGYASFSNDHGNTTNTTLEFTVIEPYSMGMFMQAVQVAAYNQKYKNWNEAPYLLSIEFRGNTENGQMVKVPNTTKFITFHFNTCNMKVTEAGSVYTIQGYTTAGKALNDEYKKLKTDTTVSGSTVQEMLQSGPKSLQQVVNARLKQLKDKKIVKVPDEILIMFPTNISSSGAGSSVTKPGNTETKDGATKNPTSANNDEIFKTLGVKRVDVKISSNSTVSSIVQNDGTCNALGKATMNYNKDRSGDAPFALDNDVWNPKTKSHNRSKVAAKPGSVDFKFAQDSDIINAINQVMIKSNIPNDVLKFEKLTPEGMYQWWRIDTQAYHIVTDENLKITGQVPKLIVYRVIPYYVHASKTMAPNAPAPGIEELTKQAVKEYNYIYTGKNVDLIRFEFTMHNAFYTSMATDNYIYNGDVVSSQQASGVADKPSSQNGTSSVSPPSGDDDSIDASSTKYDNTKTSNDNIGGTSGDIAATRAAKIFHDAVINSMDMMNITCDIIGDPYYISNSGTGNFTDKEDKMNITKDGSMHYQNGEVHIVINFRTPTDINSSTGMYNLKNNKLCQRFSGLYRLTNIRSEFKGGLFKQTLTANRLRGQNNQDEPKAKELLTASLQPVTDKGLSVDTEYSMGSSKMNTLVKNTGADMITPQFGSGKF